MKQALAAIPQAFGAMIGARYNMKPERAFRCTAKETAKHAEEIVLNRVSRLSRSQKEMMRWAIVDQGASEYPFIFRYSFCRTESDIRSSVRIAAAVHILQASTFITDDIFDKSQLRYHRPTIHCRYNVPTAIIAAELLQSIALETIDAELAGERFQNTSACVGLFHQLLTNVYLAQYLDLSNSRRENVSVDDYFTLISLGAGHFLGDVAKCGALLAGKSPRDIKGLSDYAYCYGMALFIMDDVVDVIQGSESTGKGLANDLRERRMKLPMILALRLADPRAAQFLREFLRTKSVLDSDIKHVSALIEQSGALSSCMVHALKFVQLALRSLARTSYEEPRVKLGWLAESLVKAQGLAKLSHKVINAREV